ncbi:hypothetical protein [Streptomyces sp. NPDC052114]|uniref:hypothetical protein n=1 Tax=unclassified Streptomyces TaxID=2593676 RepID=UPI0034370D63
MIGSNDHEPPTVPEEGPAGTTGGGFGDGFGAFGPGTGERGDVHEIHVRASDKTFGHGDDIGPSGDDDRSSPSGDDDRISPSGV